MVSAIKDPEKCPEALEDLMHTTFVHPVDASSLSIIVPILSRYTFHVDVSESKKSHNIDLNRMERTFYVVDQETNESR
jgi:hypothetical protein